ncbi:MAG: DUF4870 domain-containing protein [Phycisphaerales bacterium]|jgi:uncharacterized Tic20 family protein|nr:DUF4870 domain-containing protein [Phycisphaerales bacterium]
MSNENQFQHEHRDPPINARGRAFDPDATDDERTFALMLHLSLLAHVVLTGFAILVPIIMWNIKKEESPFLDDHGREAINFQISLIIYSIIWIPIAIITCGIGAVLVLLPYVLGIVGMIQAAMAANRGEFYRYPMTFRFLK